MVRVLFLPANQQRVIEEEDRSIYTVLESSQDGEQINLKNWERLSTLEFLNILQDVKPDIIHFSGHASKIEALPKILYKEKDIVAKDFISSFASLKDPIKCVVLNACYSENQANEIAKYIQYVIGTPEHVSDQEAKEFSYSFYKAVSDGYNIKEAFELTKSRLDLKGFKENLLSLKENEEISHHPIQTKNDTILQNQFQHKTQLMKNCYNNIAKSYKKIGELINHSFRDTSTKMSSNDYLRLLPHINVNYQLDKSEINRSEKDSLEYSKLHFNSFKRDFDSIKDYLKEKENNSSLIKDIDDQILSIKQQIDTIDKIIIDNDKKYLARDIKKEILGKEKENLFKNKSIRKVNIWIEGIDTKHSLVIKKPYKLGINIGQVQKNVLVSTYAETIEKISKEVGEINLTVVLVSHYFNIQPKLQELILPTTGDSKPVYFTITPKTIGVNKKITVLFYYNLNLIQILTISLNINKDEHQITKVSKKLDIKTKIIVSAENEFESFNQFQDQK